MAKQKALDFSKVKERGDFNPKHQTPGDKLGKVVKVEDGKTSTDKEQWVFTVKVGTGTYPYRCQFEENVLWKIRNMFVACGFTVGKKRINVNPDRCVGKEIGVSLDDHEYENKLSSEIVAVFPKAELDPVDVGTDDSDTDDDEDNEDFEAEAKPAKTKKDKKSKKGKKSKVDSVDVKDL